MDLTYRKKNFYEEADKREIKECFEFAEGYKKFLDVAKTEREACEKIVEMAKEAGFKEYKFGDKILPHEKRYFVNRGKSVVLFRVNEKLENGLRILGAHIDSPRIDLKANPIYEDNGFCFLKTHYYGGIKKYQWSKIPDI